MDPPFCRYGSKKAVATVPLLPWRKEDQLLRLSRHVKRKLSRYGEEILNGNISLSPYELREEDACRFCSYHSVCGFDSRLEGCEKRQLEPLEKEEIWKKLEEEES